MIRIAMLSKWHVHAAGYASQIQKAEDAAITCVWDDDAARGLAWAKELSVDFDPDLDQLLAREDVDADVVDTPTSDHARVMVAAARAGKHIFTEKAMAPTPGRMPPDFRRPIARKQVKFCISFPNLDHIAGAVCPQGDRRRPYGRIHYFRMRTAHAGA
jgi:hypothetical protein